MITLGRLNQVYTDAVIDIKGIPECHVFQVDERICLIGAAVTLTELSRSLHFRLLAETAGRIADHTTRNKITFGGNLCGEIIYKEAVLPLLLADSDVIIAGPDGLKEAGINEIFYRKMQLKPGECVFQIRTASRFLHYPYYSVKKRKLEEIDYPLVTLAALKVNENLRVAVSGVCDFPFRSREMEAALNQEGTSLREKIEIAMQSLPAPVLNDAQGSAEFRKFMFAETLNEAVTYLEEDAGG